VRAFTESLLVVYLACLFAEHHDATDTQEQDAKTGGKEQNPGSNAGLPGLSLYAGLTPGGLPVGLEIDGPVGSD